MNKVTLAVAAVSVTAVVVFAPSIRARAQAPARFEYLRVHPYQTVSNPTPGHVVYRWSGYRACIATTTEWSCRNFDSDDALRTTLATLGNEGWELVSAVDERHELNQQFGGLTYLFKRQRQ